MTGIEEEETMTANKARLVTREEAEPCPSEKNARRFITH